MFSKVVSVSIAAVVLTTVASAAAIPLDSEPKLPMDIQHSHLPVGIPISSAGVPTITAHIVDSHDDDHVPAGINNLAPDMTLYTPSVSNPLNWPLGIPITESIKPREASWTAHPTVAVPPQQALVTDVPLFTVAKGDGSDNVWVPPTVKDIRTSVFGEGMAKRAQVPTLVATPTLKTVYTPVRVQTPTLKPSLALKPTLTPTLKPQPKPSAEMYQLLRLVRNAMEAFRRRIEALRETKDIEQHATIAGSAHTSGQVQLPDRTYHDFEDTAYHHPEQVHAGAKHEASHIPNLHPNPVLGNLQHEASHIADHHPDPVHGNLQHEASHIAYHHSDPVHGNLQHGAIPTPSLQPPKLNLSPEQLRRLTPEQRRVYGEALSKIRNAKEQEALDKYLHGLEDAKVQNTVSKESHSFHPGHIDVPDTGRSFVPVKRADGGESIFSAISHLLDHDKESHKHDKSEGGDELSKAVEEIKGLLNLHQLAGHQSHHLPGLESLFSHKGSDVLARAEKRSTDPSPKDKYSGNDLPIGNGLPLDCKLCKASHKQLVKERDEANELPCCQ